MARQGVLVEPYQRLKLEQVERIHRASLAILTDPGVVCFNRSAAEVFGDHGAEVLPSHQGSAACWLLKIPEKVITDALQSAPKVVKLGARDENNCLILDGREPRVYFASGSETNNWLEVDVEAFVSKRNPDIEVEFPVFRVEKGTVDRLAKAACLCEHLDSWDSFRGGPVTGESHHLFHYLHGEKPSTACRRYHTESDRDSQERHSSGRLQFPHGRLHRPD